VRLNIGFAAKVRIQAWMRSVPYPTMTFDVWGKALNIKVKDEPLHE